MPWFLANSSWIRAVWFVIQTFVDEHLAQTPAVSNITPSCLQAVCFSRVFPVTHLTFVWRKGHTPTSVNAVYVVFFTLGTCFIRMSATQSSY